MEYYFNKSISNITFEEAIERVKSLLKEEGFGILTEIDINSTLKEKIGVDFRKYRILGACNPPYAYKALSSEINIGTMLPCNVIVYENDEGNIDVSAVNPTASMMAVQNKDLEFIAKEVVEKLMRVISKL